MGPELTIYLATFFLATTAGSQTIKINRARDVILYMILIERTA